MAAAGLGDRVMALRPQDRIEPDDLKQNWQRDVRRAYLFTWLRSVADFNNLDQGLAKFVIYRGLRRLWRGTRPAASHHQSQQLKIAAVSWIGVTPFPAFIGGKYSCL
jgi:hypothetical protein